VTKTPGSRGLIVPFLARGDIDVAPQVMVPAFFNQYTQGFSIKVVATLDETHKGWNDTVYFMVRMLQKNVPIDESYASNARKALGIK
jgi:hypothetical protein